MNLISFNLRDVLHNIGVSTGENVTESPRSVAWRTAVLRFLGMSENTEPSARTVLIEFSVRDTLDGILRRLGLISPESVSGYSLL